MDSRSFRLRRRAATACVFLPPFQNKVDDAKTASVSASRADLLSIASSQIYTRSRPGSAASFSIKSSKFNDRPESALEGSRIMRVEYVPEPGLVQRLKKLKENGEQSGEAERVSVPDKLFEVEDSSQANLQKSRKNFAKIASLHNAAPKPFPTGAIPDNAMLIQYTFEEEVPEPVEAPKPMVKPKTGKSVKTAAPKKFSQENNGAPTTSAAGIVKPKRKSVKSKNAADDAQSRDTPVSGVSFVKPKKAHKKIEKATAPKFLEINVEQNNPKGPIFIKPKKRPQLKSVADDAV